MNVLEIVGNETVLKQTTSRCVVCRKPKPAQVVKIVRSGREQVVMRRNCPCHGAQEYVLASDARFYWLAQGDPSNTSCGCGPTCAPAGSGGKQGYLGANATDGARFGTIEKLSTCLALIEIVDSCNLACPACFADSPVGVHGSKLKYYDFDNITNRVQGVIDRKGRIEILQFSGGEPTIHPEFFRLVEWARTNPGIDYLLINTNGVRFAKDDAFVQKMGELYRTFDKIQLYFKFDGPQEEGQLELRGADLREMRQKAIANCGMIGLPVTLTMTVNEDNLKYIWDTVEFGLAFEHIRGVSFQPMFLSGRVPSVYQIGGALPQPITAADIILGLCEKPNTMSFDDFTPLPCGDPNCAAIGWLFRMGGRHFSPAAFGIDIPALQASLPDRINYDIEDLRKCGCESTPLGDLMKRLEVKESHAFRIFIKPFMDTRTWDDHRIDRCCTHVIRPDGVLDSFCRYYYGDVPEAACC